MFVLQLHATRFNSIAEYNRCHDDHPGTLSIRVRRQKRCQLNVQKSYEWTASDKQSISVDMSLYILGKNTLGFIYRSS